MLVNGPIQYCQSGDARALATHISKDPTTIGPAMAVALLTTFYGAVLANMVFSPMAAKLERNSTAEATVTSVYMMAISSIGRQESPRRLEMLINSCLPPSKRIQYFD